MANHKILIDQSNCIDICTYTREVCLPERENCTPTCLDWIIRDCEQVWNCRRKQSEKAYFHPVVDGDLIMFQTKMFDFFNVDRTQPTNGWGDAIQLQVFDSEGTLLVNDFTTIATRWLYGWDGDNSYQLIEIDTSQINSECFNFRWEGIDPGNGVSEVYCSEDFRKVVCESTVKVKSEYCDTDCCNNFYGLPNDGSYVTGDGHTLFRYDNTSRYFGVLVERVGGVEKQTFNNIVVKTTTTRNFDLNLTALVPPNIGSMLMNQHLGGSIVIIDDNQYLIENTTPENRSNSRMQMFNVELFTECEVDFRCC